MDIERQKQIVEELLKIPISDIEFTVSDAAIFSLGRCIGTVPYKELNGTVVYDTRDIHLNRLEWRFIFYMNTRELIPKMIQLVGNNVYGFPLFFPGLFRRVFLHDTERHIDIANFECEFDGEWSVKLIR
ncbi:MAG: hypothetical protein NTU44_15740 [Bacteroidetes bacterium]|nr:hypothetical protein [Bacteroidota bacterium]